MSLESSKTLGGIGALLIVIGLLGTIAYWAVGILGIVGIILFLIAMKGLSDYYKEEGIFNNTLYGFIVGIVGGVISGLVLVVGILVQLATEFWTAFEGFQWTNWPDFWNIFGPILVTIITAWVVFVISQIISALLYRKSLTILSKKSDEKMFGTAGLLMLIGAALTIVLVGVIVTAIAWILATVGFFSIKTPTTPPPPPPTPPQAPAAPTEKTAKE